MIKPADLLLLDEPTNDLDIPSLEVLEQSLMEFPGALVLVTHDRYLLGRVSRQILALDGKGNADFFADLSQWEDFRMEQRTRDLTKTKLAPYAKKSEPALSDAPVKTKKTLSSKEKNELEGMDATMHTAEQALKAAKARLEDPKIGTDIAKLLEEQKKVEAEQSKVEALFKRWEELEAKKNQIV
jgi:ATP-binding cassette subfamily F protein uup